MSALNKQIARASRLFSLDQSKFDALAAELGNIDSVLSGQQRRIEQMEVHMGAALGSEKASSVGMHRQTLAYVQNVELELVNMRGSVRETEVIREEVLGRVVQQKAKLKGWEVLLGKLKTRLAMEQSQSDVVQADDRHLSLLNGGDKK